MVHPLRNIIPFFLTKILYDWIWRFSRIVIIIHTNTMELKSKNDANVVERKVSIEVPLLFIGIGHMLTMHMIHVQYNRQTGSMPCMYCYQVHIIRQQCDSI